MIGNDSNIKNSNIQIQLYLTYPEVGRDVNQLQIGRNYSMCCLLLTNPDFLYPTPGGGIMELRSGS